MAETEVSGGSLNIEVLHELPEDLIERLYELYREAFETLTVRAVARHVLHRHEFFEEMHDRRIMKYVARDEDGSVVGMTTLTRDLETVPWISPQYFATRYPEHTAREAVFYLGFTLVVPQHQRSRIFRSMIEAIAEHVRESQGVCGWDVCAYNEEVLGFSTMIETLLHQSADCTMEAIDTQLYSVVEMHGPRRDCDPAAAG